MRIRTVLTTGIAVVLMVAAARATGGMQVKVVDQPTAPVQITGCSVRSFDDQDFHLEPNVQFTNTSEKAAVGIRIGLAFFSHDPIDGDTSLGKPLYITWPRNSIAVLPPRQKDGYHDAIEQVTYPSSAFLECFIAEVKFDDGTLWVAPSSTGVTDSGS